MIRTSQTHPLQIATLPIGSNGGAVGLTFAPGKQQTHAMTGAWARDLNADLETIVQWRATHLITLLEPWELDELGILGLPDRAKEFGLQWHGLPITDGAAPDDRFLKPWLILGPTLDVAMHAGSRVVVHCKGGLGRAGTAACLLMMESGAALDADDGMRRVRAVRRGAVETAEQEAFLRSWEF